ncbi:ABC transporter ATP-binding protein [Oceanibacterium hippocampi]|nr:ABC transporter ATP-binding protein [Oceanibacterium hippocampi]
MTTTLRVRDLRVSYGPVQAVRSISFEIEPKAIVALLGANGAGKSTTLRAITGLQRPVEGEIEFEGRSISRITPMQLARAGIAFSPEGRRPFGEMSVLENLLVGAHTRPRDVAKKLDRIYEYFPRLKERSKQISSSLSGGEQQMLAIGRALMAEPKLLLLDEPTLGLAPLLAREIMRILREINDEQGISILIVEQNARMALKLCDYAYVLASGRLTAEGTGGDLLKGDYIQNAYIGN